MGRLRNYFKKEGVDFVTLCEYSKDKHISSVRNKFFHGKSHFLFYTERLHFYRRFQIRGARHIIFYELPHYPNFYAELCNMLSANKAKAGTSDNTQITATVLYNKYDIQRLSGVVSSDRSATMITAEKNVHMLITGDNS